MAKNLVIVESPAKAKTIEKYLGKDFEVLASYGHVRDLVPEGRRRRSRAQVRDALENSWRKTTRSTSTRSRSALKKADALYLATDPDREGEAISWHLQEVLRRAGALKDRDVYRVVFYEITEREVKEAIQKPRKVSMDLVNAYRTRRAMDHLIGFKLSPLLWRKISLPSCPPAGCRARRCACSCEREEEIEAFQPRSTGPSRRHGKAAAVFAAQLASAREKVTDTVNREPGGPERRRRQKLERDANGQLRRARPSRAASAGAARAAVHHLDHAAGGLAQARLPGAQHDAGGPEALRGHRHPRGHRRPHHLHAHGLRRPAQEAIDDIRGFIVERYGKASLPAQPNVYKTTAKNAQEAHEGIRPTEASAACRRICAG